MRILILGGSGLTGRHIVNQLASAGHDVTTFNRGRTLSPVSGAVRRLTGDLRELSNFRGEFESLSPDVVIHMMALTPGDASMFIETFQGIVPRAVIISSCDVYRAWGRFHRTEPGEPDPLPLTEDSPLRTALGPEGPSYDKVGVEAALRGLKSPRVTVVRYPAVYGPGDRQKRFANYVLRMAARREAILLGAGEASFRFSHAYAENAAYAVALAASNEAAAGRIYNVVELNVPTGVERVRHLASVMAWDGEIVVVPDEALQALHPERQTDSPDFRQDYVLDDSQIRRQLGYAELISYEEGLRRTADWLRTNASPAEAIDYGAEDAVLARWRDV